MHNKDFVRKKNARPLAQDLIDGIFNQDFVALSRAITLCESTNKKDRAIASEVVNACLKNKVESTRIGITGVPGVGKSTFIESFGLYLINEHQKKVAVLAVDPSSKKTKGSILGDKTRMNLLSRHESAFIRPSPSAGSLGGVAQHSRESIILCEAAGFDIIIIETVGVGQSETEVRQMCDFFLLLMLAGAGDELQGIKRGIMEMADGILINKAEGKNESASRNAKRNYQNALHLFPLAESKWSPKVEICSALEGLNMDKAWAMIEEYLKLSKDNNYFEENRKEQLINWFDANIQGLIKLSLEENSSTDQLHDKLIEEIKAKNITPLEAANKLVAAFLKS